MATASHICAQVQQCDKVEDPRFNRPNDWTTLHLGAQQEVKGTEAQKTVDQRLKDMVSVNTRSAYHTEGNDVGKNFTIQFKGTEQLATRRA
eukprot:11887792-Karenia_brevis.AAC.1